MKLCTDKNNYFRDFLCNFQQMAQKRPLEMFSPSIPAYMFHTEIFERHMQQPKTNKNVLVPSAKSNGKSTILMIWEFGAILGLLIY